MKDIIDKNGDVSCPYCSGTGKEEVFVLAKKPSLFGRFLSGRTSKLEKSLENCSYCNGTKKISWIDAVVKPKLLDEVNGSLSQKWKETYEETEVTFMGQKIKVPSLPKYE